MKQRQSLLQFEKNHFVIPGGDTDMESVSDVVGGQTDRRSVCQTRRKADKTHVHTHSSPYTSCHKKVAIEVVGALSCGASLPFSSITHSLIYT